MLVRVEVSGTQRITYTQAWDVENRLSVVTNTVTGDVTRFYYDGDGKCVKKQEAASTTVYIGSHFEKDVTTGVATSYYYAGGQRVAMRTPDGVYYLHGDHLGSASLTTDASGNQFSVQRYSPYGSTRYGSSPTDRQFNGQRNETNLRLYDYGARFYAQGVGRFVSADTMVPSPANPQSLNRYSYGYNNPVKYQDPSGHTPVCGFSYSDPECQGLEPDPTQQWAELYQSDPARLGPEMLVWMQEHQDLDQIQSMTALLSEHYGSNLGLFGLPAEFSDIYAHALLYGALPKLGGNKQANQIAGSILTEVGLGGYLILGGIKQEIAGRSSRVVYPRGQGASQGTVPDGYVQVSRWVNEAEANMWLNNQGTSIPGGIGGQSGRVYVTLPGAPKPGGTGSIRIDFFVDSRALQVAGRADWRQIYQPVQNMPIYNVAIHLPY